MSKIPTGAAEKIYDILIRYAEASPNYYDKEYFIYHFGVISNDIPDTLELNCMDDRPRKFLKKNGEFILTGKGENKVNSIVRKILEISEI